MAGDQVGSADQAQRLFLAVEVSIEVVEAVSAVRPWRESFATARWIPQENWHVTLKVLGHDWRRRSERPWGRSPVRIRRARCGLGAFPSTQRPDDDPAGILGELADLETGLAEAFRPEVRRFHPHVARFEPRRLPEPYADTALESESFVASDRVVCSEAISGDGLHDVRVPRDVRAVVMTGV